MHRQILGNKEGLLTDHINRNRLDNRKTNLRVCNSSQNGFNKGFRSDNKTGIIGVHWDRERKRWFASIGINKKHIALGRFKSKQKAIMIRKEAERRYFGDYAIVSV
jgi:hypothetical protein